MVYKYRSTHEIYPVHHGEVTMSLTKPVVVKPDGNYYDIGDLNLEFEIVGNYFDHWEDINLCIETV